MTYIPEYFEFQTPTKILAGHHALTSLASELDKINIKKALVITDKGIVEHGLLKKVLNSAEDKKEVLNLVFDDVPADSSIETVNTAAKMYRENKCDGIVAIGGGSVIDTAKGVNIVISENTNDLMQFMGHDRLTKKQQALIIIPTTSGTGSEVTLVSVIANPEKGEKMLFTSPLLQPSLTILDPNMTLSLPPHLTAATSMDALTHAVEAYSCLQKNPFSDAYAEVALKLIGENITKAVQDGSDIDARYQLALASTAAGVAFSNSMVGAVHGLGHTVGAISHVHHGVAMAILLPHVMRYNSPLVKHLYADLLAWVAPDRFTVNLTIEQASKQMIEWIDDKNKSLRQICNMPITLGQAGVKEEDLESIAKQSLNDGAMIANPKEIDEKDALEILKNAF